jgi:predicted RNA-binding Zn ribbon-like protein
MMITRAGESSAAAAAQRAAALIAVLHPNELTTTVAAAEVIDTLRAHGEPEPIEITDCDIESMRKVAGRLWAVFAADNVAAAASQINGLLADVSSPPRLSSHDGTAWHLHVDSDDYAPWSEWFAVSSAMGLAILLSDRQAKPGGLCAAPTCHKPFIDLGKGDPRRYCSTRCATRERVAAHRRTRSAHGQVP